MIKGLWAIVLWAMLIAWTARVAQSRGRSIVGWALGGGAAGGAGFGLGLLIFLRALDSDASDFVALLSVMMPLVLMVGAMLAVAAVLQRSPVHVALDKTWPIHFPDRGEGTVRFQGDKVAFEWRDGSRVAALRDVRAEADGESVRVKIDEDELCFMPLGKPDSPAGRRQQSVSLVRLFGR